MSEIDGRVQRLADRCMVGKLLTVIGGDRFGILLMRGEQINGGRGDFIGLFGSHFAQQRIARASFDQRHERALPFRAHHQVDFPIADPVFLLDDRRALVNTHPVFDLPTGIEFAIAFLAFFLTVAQMLIQRTAQLAIGPDVLINALGTQPKSARRLQPTRNLLRTPFLAQIRFDPFDYLRRHLGHLRLLLTPRQGVLVGLAGTVAALATIAAQFPADHRDTASVAAMVC